MLFFQNLFRLYFTSLSKVKDCRVQYTSKKALFFCKGSFLCEAFMEKALEKQKEKAEAVTLFDTCNSYKQTGVEDLGFADYKTYIRRAVRDAKERCNGNSEDNVLNEFVDIVCDCCLNRNCPPPKMKGHQVE